MKWDVSQPFVIRELFISHAGKDKIMINQISEIEWIILLIRGFDANVLIIICF